VVWRVLVVFADICHDYKLRYWTDVKSVYHGRNIETR